MPGVGRYYRSKLHFVGPNRDDVAMAMVQVLRPIWKAKITPHLMAQLESDEVDPKEFVLGKTSYVYIVRDADPMDSWLAKTAWPKPRLKTAITAVFRSRRSAHNYASNRGGRVYVVPEDSPQVKAWLSTGQPVLESDTQAESKKEDLKAEIAKEAAKAEKPASPEQAEAGNYRKGHVTIQGIEITIENAKGSIRSGVNKNGTPWSVKMPTHYGYIVRVSQ
jgi:hypothetical protein